MNMLRMTSKDENRFYSRREYFETVYSKVVYSKVYYMAYKWSEWRINGVKPLF
ncbi:MAG: hypothetical protein GYA60_07030, partial [Candidatus Methanofastidiosa archaeon]|nr:hypothetical protein [Candidatus Methanofastidiosa archaeon]